jgi:hypothetical protein
MIPADRHSGAPDPPGVARAAAESGTTRPGAPGRSDVNPASGLTRETIERIVGRSGLAGPFPDPARQSAFKFVEDSGRRYKVLAYPGAAAARERFALLQRTGDMFSPCPGRVENCLVHEYVEDSGMRGNSTLAEDIGGFIADLGKIESESMGVREFDDWARTLTESGIFLGRTTAALRRYCARALASPVRWDLEYLDAVPKNFVYGGRRNLTCIDSKHLHPGPEGVSLVKLHANVGEYCRREDYEAIRRVYQERVPENRLDDPAYFDFCLLYYSLFFLVANARRFPLRLNAGNVMNRTRRKIVLRIIGASPRIRFIESLRWEGAFARAWLSNLPDRVLRLTLRLAGGGRRRINT